MHNHVEYVVKHTPVLKDVIMTNAKELGID